MTVLSAQLPVATASSACKLTYTPILLAVARNGTTYLREDPSSHSFSCAENAKTLIVRRTEGGASSVILSGEMVRSIDGPGTVDRVGNIYLDDGQAIAKISPGGHLSVVAGAVSHSGRPAPGKATHSRLYIPSGIVVDNHDNLYIADSYNDTVEKVTPQDQLSIVAGRVRRTGAATPIAGPATRSLLTNPHWLAVDRTGDLYIADAAIGFSEGAVVSEVTPQGNLVDIAGNGKLGVPRQGAPALSSAFGSVTSVSVDPSGTLVMSVARHIGGPTFHVVDVNAAGTVTRVAGTVYGRAAPPACGGFDDIVGFDAAGNAFVNTANCVVEETTRGPVRVLAQPGSQP